MSEESHDKEQTHVPNFNVADTSVPAVYTNNSTARVFSTDVIIAFGDGTVTPEGDLTTVAKVVMGHSAFMQFAEYIMTRYNFIKEVLGERPRTLDEAFGEDPDRGRAAYQKYMVGNVTHSSEVEADADSNAK